MPTNLKKITLTILPLAGLLFTAPLTFAHDSWGEHGQVHNELGEEHQEGYEALDAEARTFNSRHHSKRSWRHENGRPEREHQALHHDLHAQHEDYHDGNRYSNWW